MSLPFTQHVLPPILQLALSWFLTDGQRPEGALISVEGPLMQPTDHVPVQALSVPFSPRVRSSAGFGGGGPVRAAQTKAVPTMPTAATTIGSAAASSVVAGSADVARGIAAPTLLGSSALDLAVHIGSDSDVGLRVRTPDDEDEERARQYLERTTLAMPGLSEADLTPHPSPSTVVWSRCG